MQQENREITKEEKLGALEADILNGVKEVYDLLPELGHGEAKRLLMANLQYPHIVEDFNLANRDGEALIKAFSASKRIKDAMIALGIEATLEAMVRQAMESGEIAPQGEDNG